LFALLVLAGTACAPSDSDSESSQAVSKIAALQPGWNTIEPGGDTVCSDGSPFSFFVRPGSDQSRDTKIHFYLEGGGACWNGATCDLEGDPSYTPVVDASDGESSHGVFNFQRSENPLRDYTTIFVPYCSADVHLGDRAVEYTAPATEDKEARTFTIQHRGIDNGKAALEWMFDHFDHPGTVFISGSSAGSIPSPVYAHWVAEHWPEARIAQLGDGAGGYRGATEAQPYLKWGTVDLLGWKELVDLGSDFSFEDLYVGAAARSSAVQYAQYDTAEDAVQLGFLRLSGQAEASLLPLLDANHAEITTADPGFRYFVAGGDLHTILRRPEVYSYRVGDQTFLSWLTELVEGQPLSDIRCKECLVAEGVIAEEDGAAPTSGG